MKRVHPLLIVSLILTMSQVALAEVPDFYLDKLVDTPDLMQSLPEARLPFGGEPYCGPVAVSNALVWLARNGFDRLASPSALTPSGQGALASLLGTSYMGTTLKAGTSAKRLLTGLKKYVTDRGYEIESLRYQGTETVPKEFRAPGTIPDLDRLKSDVLGNSAVILNIGWYKHNRDSDRYRQFAAHYVTLVGFGKDEQGKLNPNVFIVHDPAPRSGPKLSHDYVTAEKIDHGAIDWGQLKGPSLIGFSKLGGGLKIKDGADLALLQGVIVLRVKK